MTVVFARTLAPCGVSSSTDISPMMAPGSPMVATTVSPRSTSTVPVSRMNRLPCRPPSSIKRSPSAKIRGGRLNGMAIPLAASMPAAIADVPRGCCASGRGHIHDYHCHIKEDQRHMSRHHLHPIAMAGVALALLAGPAAAQESCAAGTKLFESPLLIAPVCVPEKLDRVAFIDDNVMSALELGIPSITTSYYSDVIVADFPGTAKMLDKATTTDIGNTWEMSGEVLLAAEPDLVITGKYWDEAIPLAQDVAPTLIIDDEKAPDWRGVPRLIATLFGKEAEQAALEAGVDGRVASFRAALDAAGGS